MNCPVVLSKRHHVIPRCVSNVHVYLICSRIFDFIHIVGYISLVKLHAIGCHLSIHSNFQLRITHACMQSMFRFSLSTHSWLIIHFCSPANNSHVQKPHIHTWDILLLLKNVFISPDSHRHSTTTTTTSGAVI